MFELCASILAANFACLERDVRAADAAGVDAFHIDIMDGHFVPAISFGTGIVCTMRKLTAKPLDVHLMVEYPLVYVEKLAQLGADRVSVHCEIPGGPEKALRAIKKAGMRAGLALNPESPCAVVRPYMELLDQILLMTVHPGQGGQAYLLGSNEKIAAMRGLLQDVGSNAVLQVDGGVTPRTILPAYAAGAQSFVSGSAIFKGKIDVDTATLKRTIENDITYCNTK